MAKNNYSLAHRPQHNWWAMLARGEVISCSATSKRSGARCRMPPTTGCGGVCFWHGARGGNGNFRAPTSKRNLGNKETKRARLYAEAEVARRVAAGEQHPETFALFRDTSRAYPNRLYLADEGRLWLAIDDHLRSAGNPVGAWRALLRAFGLAPPRPPPAPAPAGPKPSRSRQSSCGPRRKTVGAAGDAFG